ncbi:MAG: hypothetical protein JRF55_15240 [Deltaproteobacteria bacterium]|nr:hypothetical protein [Deltaproteobacteria bacterium]
MATTRTRWQAAFALLLLMVSLLPVSASVVGEAAWRWCMNPRPDDPAFGGWPAHDLTA